MARARLPDPARVPFELTVSEADLAGIDQVLTRPEFAGWTRAEWCREIIRTALRYYVGPAGARGSRGPRPTAPGPRAPEPRAPQPAAQGPVAPEPVPPEPPAQPECPHPAGARDYESGTCAACGAILWD